MIPRRCAYAGRMFTSLDWYVGMRIARWLHRRRPKAGSRDILASCQPSSRRPTRRLWRKDWSSNICSPGPTPVCRFRLAWMAMPDFAMSSGEPSA
ncbi:group II intron maturase-specific domain-containing protein [Mesorhizobium sp. ISC15]